MEKNTETTKTTKTVTASVKMNITMLTGTTAINKAIDNIAVTGKKLEKAIHECAVSVLNHVELHGDITLANRLIDAVPSLARKNALRSWFESFGKLTFVTETKQLGYDKTKTTDLGTATITAFWDFKPEAKYVPFNLTAAFNALLNKTEKALAANNKDDIIDGVLLAKLKSLTETTDVLAA